MNIRQFFMPVVVLAGSLAAAGPVVAQAPSAVDHRESVAASLARARAEIDAARVGFGASASWRQEVELAAGAAALAARQVDAVRSHSDMLRAEMAHVWSLPGFQDSAGDKQARERDREWRAYEEGQRALGEAQYDRAIQRFADVVTMKGSRVDAALYWKAFAQDRQGQRAEALTTLGALTRDYPKSRYVQQARVLEAEVRANAGQPVRPQDQADEELKLMALNALQHSAPEQAVPMLDKLLQGTASPRLKARALFVLAQSNSPQARDVVSGIARGNSTPELQSRAISYLGTQGGKESRALLSEVYGATSDVDVKRQILRAFMTAGEKDRLMNAAQTEQAPELRAEAVRALGAMGADAELSTLYAKETAVDIKRQIIRAMFAGGNVTKMTELAKTETHSELRREAIRNLGMMDSKASGATLLEIYRTDKDPEIRKAVIQGFFQHGDAASLVALARKEEDAAMKLTIVSRLSQMGDNKIATDYMLELLNAK